jgi:hypothetical protein
MSREPLRIFDPRRNFQLQGFTGRGATTTIHDASATGVSISGIFQAAEDFAVLGFYNAYDYFNHLRQKQLPRTDLSGLVLEFDIEYDHALDGAMRLDAAKYPSVSWDSMTFVCGKGEIQEVKLLSYATVVSGGETPASLSVDASGAQADEGRDHVVVVFRDTQYDCIPWVGCTVFPGRSPRPTAPSTCGPPISIQIRASWSGRSGTPCTSRTTRSIRTTRRTSWRRSATSPPSIRFTKTG